MKTVFALEQWNRREHFRFFTGMDDPYFSLTVRIDFTVIYEETRRKDGSSFPYAPHRLMRAVNRIENFRSRIEEDHIVKYDTIHVSSIIGRPDGTFGFGFLEYHPERDRFVEVARREIERVRNTPDWPETSTPDGPMRSVTRSCPVSTATK